MKLIFTFFFFVLSLSLSAQTYSVRKTHDVEKLAENDSITRSHIFQAGDFLRKSANCQVTAIGLTALSGLTAVWGANAGDKADTALYTVSVLSGVAAVITEIFGITWKHAAGRELKIGAGELIYRF